MNLANVLGFLVDVVVSYALQYWWLWAIAGVIWFLVDGPGSSSRSSRHHGGAGGDSGGGDGGFGGGDGGDGG